jgi:hypothetical protein
LNTGIRFWISEISDLRKVGLAVYRYLIQLTAFVEYHIPEIEKSGEKGIRTLGTLAGTLAFQASPFDHSGISPKNPRLKKYRVFSLQIQ